MDEDFRGSGKSEVQYWADKAVRSANVAMFLAVLSVVLQIVSWVLRLAGL